MYFSKLSAAAGLVAYYPNAPIRMGAQRLKGGGVPGGRSTPNVHKKLTSKWIEQTSNNQ